MSATPEQVIEAVKGHLAEQPDLAAVGWSHGTTALVVLKWDSTVALYVSLTEDLSAVASTDYVERPR